MTADEMRIRKELADLLVVEYAYWREVTDEQIIDFSMGAMGAVANVLAALLMGLTPTDFLASKKTGIIRSAPAIEPLTENDSREKRETKEVTNEVPS